MCGVQPGSVPHTLGTAASLFQALHSYYLSHCQTCGSMYANCNSVYGPSGSTKVGGNSCYFGFSFEADDPRTLAMAPMTPPRLRRNRDVLHLVFTPSVSVLRLQVLLWLIPRRVSQLVARRIRSEWNKLLNVLRTILTCCAKQHLEAVLDKVTPSWLRFVSVHHQAVTRIGCSRKTASFW